MARTRAELRTWLRRELGDNLKASGTVDSGTITTLVDAAVLVQADDFWNGYVLNIETAAGADPEEESREITDFVNSTNTLTTDPFSAAVDTGDTYTIAFFSDSQLNEYINEAIQDIARQQPYYTTATISAVDGQKRYDFPTGARRIDAIKYINTTTEEEIDYEFTIEPYDKQIVFTGYWNESKTLTAFITKDHTALTTDAGTTTVEEEHEIGIIIFAQILAASKMRGFVYETAGELKPIHWARGQVSQNGGTLAQWMQKYEDDLLKRYKAILGVAGGYTTMSMHADADVSMTEEETEYLKA